MSRFKDNQKRIWILQVNVPAARKVRELLDVNVLNLQEALPRLAADPILLVDVLYVLCREQANQRGISDEEFGESLVGEAIGEATDALVDALINFSPPRQREILKNLKTISEQFQEQQAGLVKTTMDQLKLRPSTSGRSSPGSRASSATNHKGR